MTATAIVEAVILKRGLPIIWSGQREGDPRMYVNEAVYMIDGTPLLLRDSHQALTKFVWFKFGEAPSQAAIKNAIATLISLAEPQP